MKKIFILALMMLGTSVAFAADSEPLKEILKAKDYKEAAQLIEQNLSQLLNSEEKAKAYNKLLELASEKFEKEILTITENQAAEQLGKGKVQPYDTLGFYDAAYTGVMAGLECDKYDQMPNEKGKVKPRYRNLNQPRLERLRLQLVNGGQWAAQNNDADGVLKYWGIYAETAGNPAIFADSKQQDLYVGQVASFAARYALQKQDYERANRYVDVAMQDPEEYKNAISLKMLINEKSLKTAEDTVKFLKQVEGLYAQDNSNDILFSTLSTLYGNMGKKAEAEKLIADKIAQQPDHKLAWALKGQNHMNAGEYDQAIDAYKHGDLNNVIVLTYLGFCLNSKAGNLQTKAERNQLYQESTEYLEKARDLDPYREQANWAYPLYQAYYNLYGDADSRTKKIEKMIGQ